MKQHGTSTHEGCQSPSPAHKLLPLATLLLWGVSSSALIVINKKIMVDLGFKFPLVLTGLNQAASALAAWAASCLGFMPLGNRPKPMFMATHLLPVAACAAGTLFFGNVAYLSLSVAFIQILKVLTPAVTLAICVALRLESLSLPLAGSIMLISAGTGIATVVEMSAAGFVWAGFIYFMLSVLLESIRVVSIQFLLGARRYNEVQVLVFLGSPTAVILLLASAVYERASLLEAGNGFSRLQGHGTLFLAAMIMGAVVNLATALAIRNSSSLTFKVSGCVKNIFVVLYGMMRGDHVSPVQFLGYGISVAGFAWYTHAKGASASVTDKKKQ